MLFPALGMSAATWLMMSPLFGLETGLRAGISVAAGILALPLAVGSIWSARAGAALTAVGMILCFIDLTTGSSISSMANYAACGSALAIAGMAPMPASTFTVAAADDAPTARTRTVSEPLSASKAAAA